MHKHSNYNYEHDKHQQSHINYLGATTRNQLCE